jgi:hypothetical protein
MVFAMAGKAEDRERIQRNVDWLVNARVEITLGRDKVKMKGWSYTRARPAASPTTPTASTPCSPCTTP